MSVRSFGVWPAGLAATNRTAKNVTRRGVHYEAGIKAESDTFHSKLPPPIHNRFTGPRNQDLTGSRFGSFTVLGVFERKCDSGSGRTMWCVKCACGAYEIRSAKAIKNPKNSGDMCRECRHVAYIRRRSEWDMKDADLRIQARKDREAAAKGGARG